MTRPALMVVCPEQALRATPHKISLPDVPLQEIA
jgi:hypothetical protein